jgi:hypothetical protein
MNSPAWWLGAPFIAGAYVFLTPRVLPDVLPAAANSPPLRWLVGLLLGVAILTTWQVVRWALGRKGT